MSDLHDWPDFVEYEANLTKRNTLALTAHAALYARITDVEQLRALAERGLGDTPTFVLGGGSNLVLTGDFDGLILHVALLGRSLVAEDDEAWFVQAGAGENWHEFVQWTLQAGYPGLENLSLIPGTVGASPIQNIGAYGLEVADRFHALTAIDMQTGALRHFDHAACRFGYRDSLFKQEGWHQTGRFVITDVTFRLPKRWQPVMAYADVQAELKTNAVTEPSALQIAEAISAIRQRKLPDPALVPNTGSFFKNPVVSKDAVLHLQAQYPTMPSYPQPDGQIKLAAGWLIEKSGWKGRDLGLVGMYEKQALVLVNHGGATGADVAALMQAVQQSVQSMFAVELEPEPVFL